MAGTRITEWRWRRVIDIRVVETPRIFERSFRDNGLNASTIAPKMHLKFTDTSGSLTSGNAYSKTWEYKKSMPARPSCVVPLCSERTSLRRSSGLWRSDSMNLAKVEAKINNPDDFSVRALMSSSCGHGLGSSRSLLWLAIADNLWFKYN